MPVKRYKIPLKLVPRLDDPGSYYYDPDVQIGVAYIVRSFVLEEMTCKIEVYESEEIENGIEIDETDWNILED